jgi:hypothetical protein
LVPAPPHLIEQLHQHEAVEHQRVLLNAVRRPTISPRSHSYRCCCCHCCVCDRGACASCCLCCCCCVVCQGVPQRPQQCCHDCQLQACLAHNRLGHRGCDDRPVSHTRGLVKHPVCTITRHPHVQQQQAGKSGGGLWLEGVPTLTADDAVMTSLPSERRGDHAHEWCTAEVRLTSHQLPPPYHPLPPPKHSPVCPPTHPTPAQPPRPLHNLPEGASVASARLARLSMMRFTHSIWTADRGEERSASAPPAAVTSATTLAVSWNCRNLVTLLYTLRPHFTADTMDLQAHGETHRGHTHAGRSAQPCVLAQTSAVTTRRVYAAVCIERLHSYLCWALSCCAAHKASTCQQRLRPLPPPNFSLVKQPPPPAQLGDTSDESRRIISNRCHYCPALYI